MFQNLVSCLCLLPTLAALLKGRIITETEPQKTELCIMHLTNNISYMKCTENPTQFKQSFMLASMFLK